jgi:hypothetical protein
MKLRMPQRRRGGRRIVWVEWQGEEWPAGTLARHLGVTVDALVHRWVRGLRGEKLLYGETRTRSSPPREREHVEQALAPDERHRA